MQGKEMLYSSYLIVERRVGFGYLHIGLGWYVCCAAHPCWTPAPPLWGSGFLVSCLSCGEHPYDGWEASLAQHPAGNSSQPRQRCRRSWDQYSVPVMSFQWTWWRSRRWGCCVPDWCKVISSRRTVKQDGANQERNGLLHALGDTGANTEPGVRTMKRTRRLLTHSL